MNCQSLINKKGPFYNLIDSTKPDIIIATETWFNNSILDSEYFSNFTVQRKERENTTGGGVLIAVNISFISTRKEKLESPSSETIWVGINITGCKSLYVGACYRPKIDDAVSLDELEASLTKITSKNNNIVLLGGDFNLPGWDWSTNSIKPRSAYPGIHRRFGDILDENGLTQIVQEPTRLLNVLDLIITNRPSQINRTQILPGISDHEVVYTEFDIKPARKKQLPRQVPLYKKADWTGFRQHAKQLAHELNKAQLTSDTESLWNLFKNGVTDGIKKYIPHRRAKTRDSQPWISRDLKRKIRRRNKAFVTSKKFGRLCDEQRFLNLKKEVQRDLRKAYWDYISDIVTPKATDSNPYGSMKRFWTFIKHKRTDANGVAPLRVNGKLINDSKLKAEALNRQFQSVFTKEAPLNLTAPAYQFPELPYINITVPGVLKLLRNLKPGKAAGPDNIGPRILKELAEEIADPLTTIFKKSLAEGHVPTDWRQANVTPIYKKGLKYDPANYRPISLTCIASKLMEHIICSSIMSFASVNEIFYALQHGFRNKRSCESQLLEFIQDVSLNMQNGHQTDVCVLDFSKAFDKVDHIRLIEKLKWYGITGSTNDWIKSFLTNRTQSVVLDGVASSNIHVTSGVPQGSVLGPCLFLFYINDIAQNLHSTTRLFADDTMIYMTMKNETDAKFMQEDLDTLQDWEKKWMMEFHPQKCEVISITRKRKPKKFTYTLHGKELEHVQFIKYLGVHITHDLRWDKHVDYVTSKATNVLNFLRRNINIRNTSVKQQAYRALVRPILEYSNTVWDPYTNTLINKIEMVQRRAARFALHRYHRTSSVGTMLQNLDWQPLAERRRILRLSMFYKMQNQLVAIDPAQYLTSKNHQAPTRCENTQAFHNPQCSRDYYRMSFFPRTVRDWNCLPEESIRAKSAEVFKNLMQLN